MFQIDDMYTLTINAAENRTKSKPGMLAKKTCALLLSVIFFGELERGELV